MNRQGLQKCSPCFLFEYNYSVLSGRWKSVRIGSTIKINKYITREEKTMCTRFVYRGDNTISGFNFEIVLDLAVWDHKIITEKDRFYRRSLHDGVRHSYDGVKTATEMSEPCCMFTETRRGLSEFQKSMTNRRPDRTVCGGEKSVLTIALRIVQERKILYAPEYYHAGHAADTGAYPDR